MAGRYFRLRCAETDVDLRFERAMDGAFAGDLDQLGALLGRQRTGQLDLRVYPVEHPFLRLALFAILRVNARMPKRDRNVFQWELLSARVQPDGHRCANAQSDKEVVVRARCRIGAAGTYRFVRAQVMVAADNFLQEPGGVAADNDVRWF